VVDLQSIAKFQPLRTIFPFFIQLGEYVKLPGFKDAIDLNNRLKRYAIQSVDRYKEMLENRPFDPKPTLFTKMFNAGENGLAEEEIRSNALTYIAAGSDTTALTLTYLLFTVCQNKDIYKKLVAEVQGLPDNFTDDDCRDAPYLNQVITETLRLYSPVSASLPRVTPPDGAKLAGYEIPPGVIVSTQAYTYHRDPKIFRDPERYVVTYINYIYTLLLLL
jgi:cytochrome P450